MNLKTIKTNSLEIFKQNEQYEDSRWGWVNTNAYISVVATNACQCNCPYCINSATDRSKHLPIEKAVNNIKELIGYINNEPEVIILGGEPLLHPQILELIKSLRTMTYCGIKALGKVRITTNGIRLKEDSNFIKALVDNEFGVEGINISFHNEDFMTLEELHWVYETIKQLNPNIKVRVNTNIWRGNLDNIEALQKHLNDISFVDEVRVSNIIRKDSFSVNPQNFGDGLVLPDEEYINLFTELIGRYSNNYTIFENPKTLGFVRYFLIPTPCPIIVNWNLGSTVSEQICENEIGQRKINTFKCLVSGDISLSWNTNNIINLKKQYK